MSSDPSSLTEAELTDHLITCDGRGKAYKAVCLGELVVRLLKRAQAWRNMDTAPKDGTRILVKWEDQFTNPTVTLVMWYDGDWMLDPLSSRIDPLRLDGATFLSWQPLPSP